MKKKITIALAILGILIAAGIFITAFVGWGVFGFGQAQYRGTPPPANATLFEKAEWEQHHGSICQCAPIFVLDGPICILPSSDTRVSKVSFNMSLTPGMIPSEMKHANFTLSTSTTEKTVSYDDPAVNVTWILEDGTRTGKQDLLLEQQKYVGLVSVELDLDRMGFASPALGPDERFSLVITPLQGYRYAITRGTPAEFRPGIPIEIPGWPKSPFSH